MTRRAPADYEAEERRAIQEEGCTDEELEELRKEWDEQDGRD